MNKHDSLVEQLRKELCSNYFFMEAFVPIRDKGAGIIVGEIDLLGYDLSSDTFHCFEIKSSDRRGTAVGQLDKLEARFAGKKVRKFYAHPLVIGGYVIEEIPLHYSSLEIQ